MNIISTFKKNDVNELITLLNETSSDVRTVTTENSSVSMNVNNTEECILNPEEPMVFIPQYTSVST